MVVEWCKALFMNYLALPEISGPGLHLGKVNEYFFFPFFYFHTKI